MARLTAETEPDLQQLRLGRGGGGGAAGTGGGRRAWLLLQGLIVGLEPACLCSNWPHWTPKLVWVLPSELTCTRACSTCC